MQDAPQAFTFVHSNRRIISAWGGLDKLGDLAKEAGTSRPAVVMDGFFENSEMAARVGAMLQAACGKPAAFHFVPAHEQFHTKR